MKSLTVRLKHFELTDFMIKSKRRTALRLVTLFALIAPLLVGLQNTATAQGQAQPHLPTVTLSIKGTNLKTEIANTPEQRYMGLSFRKSMAENEAMLFVYPAEQKLVFTMRNTLIPLSIAYISKDFIINEIQQMPVGDNLLFPANAPAQYALEVNQGWFKRNRIGVGSQITMQP